MKTTHSVTDTEISVMRDVLIILMKGIAFVFLVTSAVALFFGGMYLIGKGGFWLQISYNHAFRIFISVLTSVLIIIFWYMIFCILKTKDGTEEHNTFCVLCTKFGLSLVFLLGVFISIFCNTPDETPTDLALVLCTIAIIIFCMFGGIIIIANNE
ncbi:hypothetical protein [Mangrovibacter phragmitis]|uniref:hypothetical protein n=1 Tax=Mangrovibacter phragmitis TaxID=1691903 RepID=UPI00336AC62D